MDAVSDEDRRRRLRALEERIRDPRSVTNIDCLLDTVQALVTDCDHASVKRMKNIEAYLNRCKYRSNVYRKHDTCSLFGILIHVLRRG